MSRSYRGFTIIDVIVGVALLTILFLTLLGVLRASLVLSIVTKAKAGAVETTNAQMEYLHGLTYDNLGTVGGIPGGAVPQVATTTLDGIIYVTRTYIQYQDDPADGSGASDTNHVTTDYKIGKVTVTYSVYGLTKSVTLVSNFAPPGIESSTGGGTLSLHVVDASGADMANATVAIVNASTSPTINLTTFSDTSGLVLIGGAATSSQYRITVSRTGYSTAQTYARTATNINPTPGYLTVARDLTTSATFAIDRLATLVITSMSPATTTTFSDSFANASNLASQSGTIVSGGEIKLATDQFSGSAASIPLAPSMLDGWGILNATLLVPATTTVTIHVADGAGTLIPDSALAGNSVGFTTFPVSLTGVSTTTYPSLSLAATLTTLATSTTPEVQNWSLTHTEGPRSYSNLAFTLTGAKTVGTNGTGQSIYKTVVNDTTGASGSVTETVEWDGYSLTTSGVGVLDSCPTSPFFLAPAQASTTSVLVGTAASVTLPIIVQNAASSTIADARVVLTKAGYAATIPTSACGGAYFNGIPAGTYTATVSAVGHATTTFPNIVVAGHVATTTLSLP